MLRKYLFAVVVTSLSVGSAFGSEAPTTEGSVKTKKSTTQTQREVGSYFDGWNRSNMLKGLGCGLAGSGFSTAVGTGLAHLFGFSVVAAAAVPAVPAIVGTGVVGSGLLGMYKNRGKSAFDLQSNEKKDTYLSKSAKKTMAWSGLLGVAGLGCAGLYMYLTQQK